MPLNRKIPQLVLTGCCLIVTFVATVSAQTEQQPKATQQPVAPVDLAQEAQVADDGSLTEKASLLIGFNIIENMKRNDLEFNLDKLIEGMKLSAGGGELPMDEEEIQSVQTAFQRAEAQKARQKQALLQEQNLVKGQEFLEANGKRDGVMQLDNGVQYEVLAEGEQDAKSPAATDRVKVNYSGSFINNEQFDASAEGQPAEFPVSGVIRGFSAALMKMKVGDKWRIFIPAELAYGKMGKPPRIGPNEALIFEVEMLDVISSADK
jgi:FKBP-type peptidyl-prolyl cis-trans isomerase FklB